MRIGLFYLLQVPRPWDDDSEYRALQEALEQIELADRLGFDTVWAVEHHFLEEYSHLSAPELLLAAASQRTERIRLGHGILALPPGYNPPVRAAERIAMLDLLSNGRVELGTGETNTDIELGAFGISRAQKREMSDEALGAIVRMLSEDPFTGVSGKYVSIPPRNVLPKPRQKPHPPLWTACSRRDSIRRAARMGVGALTFSFIEPAEAQQWVSDYYDTFEREAVPVAPGMNPNLGVVTGFMCAEDEQEAIDKGIDGAHFFAYSIAHYYAPGTVHRVGGEQLWDEFEANREQAGMSKELVRAAGQSLTAKIRLQEYEREREESQGFQPGGLASIRGAIGTPDQIREFLSGYEAAGVDEVIFTAQSGRTKHEDVCESLELFAREVLPEFKERAAKLEAEKAARLSPVLEAVGARRPQVAPVDIGDFVVHQTTE